MNRNMLFILFLVAASVGPPVAAQAERPAFACVRARSDVERLICGDASLASLDLGLDEVCRSALANVRNPPARRLCKEQRGWVKGRNDCRKADGLETWITASWTVDMAPGCVDALYRLRTAELQSVWRL